MTGGAAAGARNMNSLGSWTLLIILYQTLLSATLSWLTLSCRLAPAAREPHELALAKLLYLYEPDACGESLAYTCAARGAAARRAVLWPARNTAAAAFRSKVRVWACAHTAWLALATLGAALGGRARARHAALLGCACAGLAVLTADALHAALFLRDVRHTATEQHILEYIQVGEGSVRGVGGPCGADEADTSWVALLFAYASCKGVVQWLVNFWIVKDNYFESVAIYRRLQGEKLDGKKETA